jgi:adenosine deaminase
MTHLPVPELARELPKVELHCHLEGAARPSTIAALARANGVELPTEDPMELFEFADLDSFLAVYGIVCQSLVTADDFRRLTYEALEDAVASKVRYREMFFSPGFVMALGVPLPVVWDGIRAGLADAHHDLDVRCRMILDVDKPSGPGPAAELIEFAAAQDRDLLVGVGGDSTERGVDHRAFAPVFAAARAHGLRRTFHAGEDGPADNIRAAIRRPRVRTHRPRLPSARRSGADTTHRRRAGPTHGLPDQQRGHRARDRRRRRPSLCPPARGGRARDRQLG